MHFKTETGLTHKECPLLQICRHAYDFEVSYLPLKMDTAQNPAASTIMTSLLKRVRDKELREFIETYAAGNPELETEFLLHFADRLKITGKEKYLLLLQEIIGHQQPEIHYVPTVAKRLDKLLQQAAGQLAIKNYLDPFHLAVGLIELIHPLVGRADDPDALLHGKVVSAFSILDAILHTDAGPQLKELIFETALQEALRPAYRDQGLEEYWIDLLLAAVMNEEQQLRLLELLDQLIHATGSRHQDVMNERYEEFFLRKKMLILHRMGRPEEAKKVLENNLRIRTFRRELIDEYVRQRQFESAKELIKESKRSDQQKGRLYASSEWDELLLNIAEEENDVRQVRQSGLRLFYDQFRIVYYRKVKATYTAEKWKPEVEKIIDTLKAETHFGWKGIRALATIFVEEQYWQRLLALVQKNATLEFAEDFYELLKDRFPEELVDVYRVALRRYAEQHMGREHYNYIVSTLQKIQSLPSGVQVAKTLTNEFKVKYSSRRNMVKALNKLVF